MIYMERGYMLHDSEAIIFRLHFWNPDSVLVMGVITITSATAASGSEYLTTTQVIQLMSRWINPVLYMYFLCCGANVRIIY